MGFESRVLTGVHFMQGNYAAVEGALAAGCDFFAGYPITPANEVSEGMARRLPAVGGVFFQGEDELCSIYAAGAASLAGAKAMTATASAGFDYMMEGIEYAVAIEAPLVIAGRHAVQGRELRHPGGHHAGAVGGCGRSRDDCPRPVDGPGDLRLHSPGLQPGGGIPPRPSSSSPRCPSRSCGSVSRSPRPRPSRW